ncbi:hypothetical protein [Amycolatopsis suaedae]|uniref:XRE family transcriptional regulator n=1 Tax=Amycolatopsis suaedae TaxID=2510978 RepID=A0A4V2EKZ7_9PSEU|nr:hypothetical protein [Amycolatopsis suaedae]RZQ59805.1 hypothetical protein EWH70_32330 [Amycolatopsis suaedae]
MPMLNGSVVKHRVAQLGRGRDALRKIAEATDIPYGSLRNAVGGRQELGLPRCYTLAEALELTVREILADPDGVPDLPPEQPKRPKSPPKRQDKEQDRKGPRRNTVGVR